ncbi:helix-turn-helix transcriptional regulator [Streptomyces sp. NPDC048442]|uniref:helix-turn-helix domain-containing protein n=1 Tax=Streptomyces sp. NPDC048442 TaxID=3154823 RepID=UPI00341EDD82
MTRPSPSSSAQAARKALANRLQDIRKDAGLNGRELSARCGWHPAKTTRIQAATAAPSEADIRAWCAACGAEDQVPDLIASARAVESMYVEWRRVHRHGMRKVQEEVLERNVGARVCRAYVSNVVPGFLQTEAYATALLKSITQFQGTPDDVSVAVASRMERGRLLREGNHRFAVLIEEWVLRSRRFADAETMAAQLEHLLTVMPFPSVSLGVIPASAPCAVWPLEAFYLYDDRQVLVETLTAEIKVTQPREVADYARAFTELSQSAVYGAQARNLIVSALTTPG